MKLNNESIKLINLFEVLTGARVKDCYMNNDKVMFIVEHGDIRKVVSNNGSKIKKLEAMIKKKVKIVEYSDNIVEFLKSYVSPIKALSIEVNNEIVEIKVEDMRERGILIGRDRKNLDSLKNITKKYFNVENIKVI
ncbi:NusA-like transcription termination signal-binding factor [Candidatus Woesearchaeota archaeon]|nr:NusA-like transcription termination signal-binding factor [Candidatus Woesearchaeota archaeon]